MAAIDVHPSTVAEAQTATLDAFDAPVYPGFAAFRYRAAAGADGVSLRLAERSGHGIAMISPLSQGTTLAGLERAFGQRAFLNAAGAGHQLLLYDQRGAGGSPDDAPQSWERRASDLWAVADAAGVERAVLYGVFDAGHTIAHAAAQQPGRVLGLIFNRVPLAFAGEPGDTSAVCVDDLNAWFARGAEAPLGDPLAVMAALGINEHDAAELTHEWQPTVTPAALAAQEALFRAAGLAELLPGLKAPALVIAPKRRPAMQRWAEASAALLPGARLVRPENAGETLGAMHAFLTVVGAELGPLGSRLPVVLSDTLSDSRRSVGALRRIIVPVEPNVASGRAVELACRLGEAQKAEIVLVHVVGVPHVLPLDHHLPEATRRGERALTLGQVIAAEHGLPCRTRLLQERSAAGSIVRLAGEERADLIVMALSDLALGEEDRISKTAEEVLRRAPCEVLIDRRTGR
ncbi:MAG TPA: universal stress protein [Dehalococcoidia bacterium]|nr:universal stress protein [Dehalococcoidia bacterium]